MFKCEFIGNLGADAEIKDANGTKFVTMRVAHVDKYTDSEGKTHESTVWADVTMSNTESKVIPYLKVGVKVFVRGNASLRVYSSPKDRMMKAGIKVAATEIELCGGVAELVPKQLVVPESGALVDVTKHYWCNADTKGLKKDENLELIDVKGNRYLVNKTGFVVPIPIESTEGSEGSATANENQGEKK
jgi:single-strand DNA-binding protein